MKNRKTGKVRSKAPRFQAGREGRLRFTARELASNTVIASVGAGVAAVAATGAIVPAVVAGLAGGLIGFAVMNEIPKGSE